MRGRCESIIYTDGKREISTESSGYKSKIWLREQFPNAKIIKRIFHIRRRRTLSHGKRRGSKTREYIKSEKVRLRW